MIRQHQCQPRPETLPPRAATVYNRTQIVHFKREKEGENRRGNNKKHITLKARPRMTTNDTVSASRLTDVEPVVLDVVCTHHHKRQLGRNLVRMMMIHQHYRLEVHPIESKLQDNLIHQDDRILVDKL